MSKKYGQGKLTCPYKKPNKNISSTNEDTLMLSSTGKLMTINYILSKLLRSKYKWKFLLILTKPRVKAT